MKQRSVWNMAIVKVTLCKNDNWQTVTSVLTNLWISKHTNNVEAWSYRPFSRCDHLDFTPFQRIVTKLKVGEIIVWCHVCAMNVRIHYCYWNREHDQDGDSLIQVYSSMVEGRQSGALKLNFNVAYIDCHARLTRMIVEAVMRLGARFHEAKDFKLKWVW